jgi:hypothetical protein
MRQTYFSQKAPICQASRTKVWLCWPLASVLMVGARQTWERDGDVRKCHIRRARQTCREEHNLVFVFWLSL